MSEENMYRRNNMLVGSIILEYMQDKKVEVITEEDLKHLEEQYELSFTRSVRMTTIIDEATCYTITLYAMINDRSYEIDDYTTYNSKLGEHFSPNSMALNYIHRNILKSQEAY